MTRDAFIFTAAVDARRCPVCQRVLDGSTGVSLDPEDRQPVLGLDDITCCAYCGSILVCTTIGFRTAADADLARLESPLRRLLFEFSAQHQRGRLS